MDGLSDDVIFPIFNHCDDNTKLKFVLASKRAFCVFCDSSELRRKFQLKVDCKNFKQIFESEIFRKVQFKNISVTLNGRTKFKDLVKFLNRFTDSLENLEIKNLKLRNIEECKVLLSNLNSLRNLNLKNCLVENLNCETLDPIRTLKSISFNKCNDNIFKIFTKQESLEKITVINNDWTWNGFPHEVFNEICRNCKNLDHLVFEGAGTGSYFDSDEFPFKITKLETSMISFHWYVGIKSARVSFLESQKGYLKDLTIHQLPYDFDGGKVLKYIVEEMNLNNFYYGKIPLILNGKKQKIKEFEATEIQNTSAYEMIRQFKCDKLILKLSKTDVCSDSIEKIINPPTNIFDNIKEFEIIDNSAYRGVFGVFLGLLRNLNKIQKLTLRTQDKNINTILECLKNMPNLEEISLTSTAQRATERYQSIFKFAPNLKKIYINKQSLDAAINVFKSRNVAIFDINDLQCYRML